MTEKVKASILRKSNTYPNRSSSYWAKCFNVTKEEVEYVILSNSPIIKSFKSLENNTTSNIARILGVKDHKVSKVINKYLEGCKIG